MKDGSGRSGLGSALHDLNTLVFEKNKILTGIIGGIIIFAVTVGVFWWEADSKSEVTLDGSRIRAITTMITQGTGVSTIPQISGFVESEETISATDEMTEGTTEPFPVAASEVKVIRSINASLSWTDEPDIRRIMKYENQPDSFTMKILDPSGNVLKEGTGENAHGEPGSISLSCPLEDNEMVGYIGQGDFTVSVTLDSALDYTTRLGFRTISDDGNAFTLDIAVTFYDGTDVGS